MISLNNFKTFIIVLFIFNICYSSENKNQIICSVPGGPDIVSYVDSESEPIIIYEVHTTYNGEAYGTANGSERITYRLEDPNRKGQPGVEIDAIRLKRKIFVEDYLVPCGGRWEENPDFICKHKIVRRNFSYTQDFQTN